MKAREIEFNHAVMSQISKVLPNIISPKKTPYLLLRSIMRIRTGGRPIRVIEREVLRLVTAITLHYKQQKESALRNRIKLESKTKISWLVYKYSTYTVVKYGGLLPVHLDTNFRVHIAFSASEKKHSGLWCSVSVLFLDCQWIYLTSYWGAALELRPWLKPWLENIFFLTLNHFFTNIPGIYRSSENQCMMIWACAREW